MQMDRIVRRVVNRIGDSLCAGINGKHEDSRHNQNSENGRFHVQIQQMQAEMIFAEGRDFHVTFALPAVSLLQRT